MLAVHWAPVNHTKHILKNGIAKFKKGVYCFPLTGHKSLDRWWIHFFNRCKVRPRKNYNGIVFRIAPEDLPAYFGHWIGATTRDVFTKEILDLKQLGHQFRETILWRLGEEIAHKDNLDAGIRDASQREALYLSLAETALRDNPKTFIRKYNDLDFMGYTLEDYQIVLSNPIPAKRIIKVLPQGNEFGRVLRMHQKDKHYE